MPHHEHDCNNCTYLGSFCDSDGDNGVMDAYLSCDASSHEYIVRYGELGDYITVGAASRYNTICRALFVQYKKGQR